MARQCGVDYKTIQNYFQILEDTFVGIHLDSYSTKIREKQITAPKFYFFDIGVARVLSESMSAKNSVQGYGKGKLFEQFIFLEILRLNKYLQADLKFSYFKTQSGLEIDLIIETPSKETIFIEIKSASLIIKEDHLKNLYLISTEVKKIKKYVLCTEKSARIIDDIHILPWQDGIKKIFNLDN